MTARPGAVDISAPWQAHREIPRSGRKPSASPPTSSASSAAPLGARRRRLPTRSCWRPARPRARSPKRPRDLPAEERECYARARRALVTVETQLAIARVSGIIPASVHAHSRRAWHRYHSASRTPLNHVEHHTDSLPARWQIPKVGIASTPTDTRTARTAADGCELRLLAAARRPDSRFRDAAVAELPFPVPVPDSRSRVRSSRFTVPSPDSPIPNFGFCIDPAKTLDEIDGAQPRERRGRVPTTRCAVLERCDDDAKPRIRATSRMS